MNAYTKVIFIVASLSLFLFASSCTTTNEIMNSWMGQPEAKLLSSWGVPNNSAVLSDGSKVLTWTTLWNDYNYNTYTCRKTFTINNNGIVAGWSYYGCAAW